MGTKTQEMRRLLSALDEAEAGMENALNTIDDPRLRVGVYTDRLNEAEDAASRICAVAEAEAIPKGLSIDERQAVIFLVERHKELRENEHRESIRLAQPHGTALDLLDAAEIDPRKRDPTVLDLLCEEAGRAGGSRRLVASVNYGAAQLIPTCPR